MCSRAALSLSAKVRYKDTDKHPPVYLGSLDVEEANRERAASKVVVAKSHKCCNPHFYVEDQHQSSKELFMMRMSLFLVWTVVLDCSGVSSTGAFVGEPMENRLKLLERKYGMQGTGQKAKKKKKTRINCKEQPLKPVCLSAKLKRLEAQMKSYVLRKRVSLLETSIKSQFSLTKRREETVEKEVKLLKAVILKLEQRVNETLERGLQLGSGSGFSKTDPVPAWPLTPVRIN